MGNHTSKFGREANMNHPANSVAAWADEACQIIEQAIAYSAEMRKIGRGTGFMTKTGCDAEYVLGGLRGALEHAAKKIGS